MIPFLIATEVNDTRLNIELSISKEDIVEDLLRETADPIPLGPDHWQGVNNMDSNVTPHNTRNCNELPKSSHRAPIELPESSKRAPRELFH